MTRPSRKDRGVPKAGRRVTCERARVMAVLKLASIGDHAHAARGSASSALIDAAMRCGCDACPAWMADVRSRSRDGRTMARDAKHAERTGGRARVGDGLHADAMREREGADDARVREGNRIIRMQDAAMRPRSEYYRTTIEGNDR